MDRENIYRPTLLVDLSVLDDRSEPTLRELRDRYFTLGVLTKNQREARQRLAKPGITSYFHKDFIFDKYNKNTREGWLALDRHIRSKSRNLNIKAVVDTSKEALVQAMNSWVVYTAYHLNREKKELNASGKNLTVVSSFADVLRSGVCSEAQWPINWVE